ncbi:MAG: hypothetical protein NTU53_20515, partial [Planctomycetota bacterium]|nr:hypothetical protein [Planctomycetota bacterium]
THILAAVRLFTCQRACLTDATICIVVTLSASPFPTKGGESYPTIRLCQPHTDEIVSHISAALLSDLKNNLRLQKRQQS